jgi:hypothetical protein
MRISQIVGLAAFLALAGFSGALAVQDRSARFVLMVADRLDHGRDVAASDVAQAAADIASPAFRHQCRSDLLRPALTVVLTNLDRMNQVRDYDGWAGAIRASQAYLFTMERCLPSDGNVWLRDALVSRAVAEDPESLRAKLTVARALMPYESAQLFARLFIWKKLSPLALSQSESLARSDVLATLLYGDDRLKTSLRKDASSAFKALVDREAASFEAPSVLQ